MKRLIAFILCAALCCFHGQSSAQGWLPLAAPSSGGSALTFTPTATTVAWSVAPSPPVTFSAVSIGTASSDRIVVAVLAVDGNATNGVISGITIGGTSATQAAKLDPTATIKGIYIYYLKVTSGTTANIVVSCSGFPGGIGLAVGIITGSATTSLGTSATSDQWTSPQSDPHSITATIPTNGVGVVGVTIDRATTPTWTNATGDANTTEPSGNTEAMLMAHTTNNSPSFTGANSFAMVLASAPFGP
jgi:hypothetical protein